jgi:lysophospholipase L1-like esterase
LGDSITSGEGDIGGGAFPWDWCSMIFSAENNYAVMVGEAMNADIRVLSQSGWGVGSAWNNNPHEAIPPVYEFVCGLLNGEKNEALGAHAPNDFAAWQPDVICINLGTNDGGAFSQPAWQNAQTGESFRNRTNEDGSLNEADVRRFIDTAKAFLYKLRRCNPQAKLLWIYGMLGDLMAPALRTAVAEYRAESGDENAGFLLLTDDLAGRGARNHPGVTAHALAAAELTAYLKK